MRLPHALAVALSALSFALPGVAQDIGGGPENLPPPDAEPADMGKPVKVFILMGQSNMLGFGSVPKLAEVVQNKGRFTHLMDGAGNWTTRRDVRNVRVMHANGSMKTYTNDWLTVGGKNFGPEIGFGHIMGHVLDEPVMVLKACIGNRALGWDLLPPGSVGYEHNGVEVPGYQGSRDKSKRPKGGWYAGKQYDDDTDCVRDVLREFRKYYPGAKSFEIAGFVWWQGHKDQKAEWAVRYERNLVQLIKSLRADFNAPEAPFVCATVGFGGRGMSGHTLTVAEAQLAVADRRKYPEFAGNVATVDARPFWRGGGAHYGSNPETYMEVGIGLGWAMAGLLENARPGGAVRRLVDEKELEGGVKNAFKALVADRYAEAAEALAPYLATGSQEDQGQIAHARKLGEYIDTEVEGAIAQLRNANSSGDLTALRDALQKNDKTLLGVQAYDEARTPHAAKLDSPEAAAELKAGSRYAALITKKERLKLPTFYGQLAKFIEENPDSFYAAKANEELSKIDAEIRKTILQIDAVGSTGDIYAKFTQVEEARGQFARIPSFEEADARWTQEYKQQETRDAFYAGKTYNEVFADLDSLNARYREMVAKNNEISGARGRAKALEKSKQYFQRKLKPIATRLEKLGKSDPDGYYGRAAKIAFEAWELSGQAALANPLGGKK